MRFSSASALFFAGNVLALARHECLVNNSKDLAETADCGHQGVISYCLSQLQSFEQSDVKKCFVDAGCTGTAADIESKYILDRCDEMGKTGELRKRYRAMVIPRADPTTAPPADKPTRTGGGKQGTECFTTGMKSTESCPVETKDGNRKTLTCFPTEVTTSECAPGWLCTHDVNNLDICMELQDNLSTGGIVVAIIFGILITLGVGTMTYLCCKDRNEQKRLRAKSEAVALARAATKKQRANQDRTPLIRNASGGSNPFQDQPRV